MGPPFHSTPGLQFVLRRRCRWTIEMKLQRIIPGQVLNLDQLHYIARGTNNKTPVHHQHGTGTFVRSATPMGASQPAGRGRERGFGFSIGRSRRHSDIDRPCLPLPRPAVMKGDHTRPVDSWWVAGWCCYTRAPIVVPCSSDKPNQDNNTAREFRSAIYCIVKCRYFVAACFRRCCFVSTPPLLRLTTMSLVGSLT